MLLPGMRCARPASVTTYSAKPPGAEAMTRSPALISFTSLPTASTSPEHSSPIRAPTPPTLPCWCPDATRRSARLRLEARTRIRISFDLGSGLGRSRTSTPLSPRTAGFIFFSPGAIYLLLPDYMSGLRAVYCAMTAVLSSDAQCNRPKQWNSHDRCNAHTSLVRSPCHDQRRQFSPSGLACRDPAQRSDLPHDRRAAQ